MRIAIATLFGLVAGCLCATYSFTAGGMAFTFVVLAWILLNRTIMGFVIGVSALRVHWAWNGVILGLVVGAIFSCWLAMSGVRLAALTMIGNALFGLMIEFLTTVVCRRPAIAAALAQPRHVATT